MQTLSLAVSIYFCVSLFLQSSQCLVVKAIDIKNNSTRGDCDYTYIPSGNTCESCGITFNAPNTRIVGGVTAIPYSWPAQVLIVWYLDTHVTISGNSYHVQFRTLCGGTIISHNTVLTAAHCIVTEVPYTYQGATQILTLDNPFDPSAYTVYTGAYDISFIKSNSNPHYPTVTKNVKNIIMHPDFNSDLILNDVALFILEDSIEFNAYTQPACLPNPSNGQTPPTNISVFASGWGTEKEGGSSSNLLNNVRLTSYDPSYCDNSGILNDWYTQFCAGSFEGGKDTCQGDSGGGLYMYDENVGRYIVVGITSYGKGCARPGLPGIYTRISYFYDFITQNWETSEQPTSTTKRPTTTTKQPTSTTEQTTVTTKLQTATAIQQGNGGQPTKSLSIICLLLPVFYLFISLN